MKVLADIHCVRDEMETVTRTWRERFVDGPVWRPLAETYQRLVRANVPAMYSVTLPGQETMIVAHPDIVESIKDMATVVK